MVFDHEKYIFLPDADEPNVASFSLRREHDEWFAQDGLPDEMKAVAVETLEKYLMKQH